MRKIYFLLLTVLFAAISNAQVANYNFAASSGTYTPLVGATNIFTGLWDDGNSATIPLGFTFTFNGVAYTTCIVNANGFISFGATLPNTGTPYTPISDATANAGVVAAYGHDVQAQPAAPAGSVDYLSSGGVFTVQWTNARRYDAAVVQAERINFQIQLIQATNQIVIVYGSWTDAILLGASGDNATLGGQVGLRGATNTDFRNLSVLAGGSWASPTAGASNTASCYYNSITPATKPALGQTYTFTPPVPCVTPPSQPTSLILTPGATAISGSFTAAAGSPSGYLVVRTPTNVPPSSPVDGTTYTPGTSALGGTIVAASPSNSFVSTGLSQLTTYYYWVYSYNNYCIGGIFYKAAAPLSQSAITTACTVTGTKTVGPTGNYATLTAAIADLNTNGLAGPVILELQSTYTSVGETFPINIPAITCMSAINTLTIRPQSGAVGLSITSANATGTINFNGGNYVTFDGRAGGVGVSQLTISNTSLTGYAIQYINSAVSNTIKYCAITGVNTGTASGVIFFNNAVGLTVGNSNNTIDNCDIHDAATTPTNLIYVSGNTADYASQDNNNIVSNCNIHDWFNATSTTLSAGIKIAAGASDWTITGNSFYQSIPRTFTMTTATDQGAINISSATFGTNFTISNNFIGGSAPLCGGAAWTYTGVLTGTPTAKMISLTAALGTASNITGNTIQNISITSATTNNLSGLISHVSGNANISGNTLGSQTATGNIAFTLTNTTAGVFFLPIGFGLGGVPCNVNVTNNNIGGITVNNSSTGSVSFRIIYGQPVAGSLINISSNLIGGTVANSIQQLSNNITHGILMLNPTIDCNYSNNTIRNITQNNVGVTGSIVGINIQTSGGRATINGNTIFNLTTNGTNALINNAASVVGISMTGSVVGGTSVSGNTIYNLTNTNTTVAGWINGMYFGTALAPQPNTIISKNFVHSISISSVIAGAGIVGIFLPNTGNAMVSNNMVRLGIDGSGSSITGGMQIVGIYKASTGSMGIYNNSVYIGGTGVISGTANTFAFLRGTSPATGTDTLWNNIFYNARSNASGTGLHVGISLNLATNINSNFNDIYVDGTGGLFGAVAATYANLAAWKAGTGLDGSSVSGNPQYLAPSGTSATVNLHINPAVATVVEQGGLVLAQVPDDIDNQARAGLTPTDIGADAGNFTLLDQSPPVITYTPLPFTCSTGDRVVTGITITDATGVPTAGGLRPRIYYKRGAGAYFSQPGTLSSGTATNGQWSFTIVASDMGVLATGDVISYYIIAQDNLGNIASNAAGVVAVDVNFITTPPAAPNTYTITGSVVSNGNYNVGAGQTFTTLTAAVAAYNTGCLTGPVTFSLTDASYAAETFPITIAANPYASATNTLTIKPTLANTTITGTSATALIVLNGADWITINGSISATNNTVCPAVAASRDLTLTNTNVSTTSAVIWLQNTAAFDAATNNNIRNLNLVGSGNTQTFVGVGCGSTTISTASLGVGNNNNTYVNNNISKTQYGIFSQGQSLGTKNTGTVINQNLINTVAPNNTARGGIVVGFENGIVISGNTISEIALASSPDVFGIAAGSISISTSTFTGNEVINAVITKNNIGSVRNTGTFSAAGIYVTSCLSGTNLIADNMLSGVSANGTSGDFSVGIYIGGGNGSSTQIYHNTVTMTSVPANTGASDRSYALAIAGVNPVVDVRNNIFVNTQNNGSSNDFAVGYGYTPFTNLTSDHNDYYVTAGSPFFIGATGSISAPTGQLTLANLQSVTGKDGNAQNVLPTFVSATNLHLSNAAGANWCLNNTGIAIGAVTDDIDCQARNNPPDIGADEFTATGFVINNPAPVCTPTTVDLTAAAVTAGSIGGLTFTYFTDAAATIPLASPNAVAVSGTYYIKASNGTCFIILPVVVVVNPLPLLYTVTGGGTYCSGGVPVGLSNSTLGINYQLLVGGSPTGAPVPGNGGAITFGNQFTAGNYTVVATNPGTTCFATMTGSVNVAVMTAPVVSAPTVTQPTPGTPTGTIVVNATGGPTLEYSLNGGAYQLSNTFTGLLPGNAYNIFVRIQNTSGCVVPYAGNPVIMNSVSVRVSDILVGSSSFQDSLWTINLANYSIVRRLGPTIAGGTITGINGLATNPLTNENYAILKLAAVSGRVLAKINVQTGACTQIGNLGDNFATLAFTTAGKLYGVTGDGATVPETMYYIDTASAAKLLYRTLGNGADGEIIAYNPDDNFFYHWSGNGTTVWEKFANDVDPIQPLTAPLNNEVFGALYKGSGQFFVSNINSELRLWDVAGTAGAVLMTEPDDLRGLVRTSCTSSLVATGVTTFCAGGSVVLNAVGGTGNYQWYLNAVPIGGATSSTYTASTPGIYNAIFTDQCGVTDSVSLGISVTVNPIPNAIATPATQAICSGSAISTIVLSSGVAGTSYNWSRDNTGTVTGIAATGTGNISGTLTNTTNAPVIVTFTITPSTATCTGAPITATVIVDPIPTVNAISNQVLCNGSSTTAVNFTGFVPGTDYNWVNNTPSIGLTGSGTGNIASFVAVNAGIVPVVATITVTPSATWGGFAYVGNLLNNTISVVNLRTNAIVATVSVGVTPQGVAVTPDGTKVYVTNSNSSNVSVISTATNTVIATVTVGSGPYGVAISPDGSKAYISNSLSNTISVINTATNTVIGAPIATGTSPIDVALSPDGTKLYTPNFFSNNVTVINTTTNTVTTTIPVGNTPWGSAVSPDGSKLYIANASSNTLSVINTATNTVAATVATGVIPRAVVVNPAGTLVYVVNEGANNVSVIDAATNTVVTTVAVGSDPWTAAISSDGSKLYVANFAANTISIVNTATNTVSGTIPGFSGPFALGKFISGTTTCTGTPQSFTITVNPTPSVNAVANQVVCNGAPVTAINFTGAVAGTVYNWTNTTPSIGLLATGTGNIASFNGVNNGTAPVVATIIVTPTYTNAGVTCTGTPTSFTITVNPTATINAVANQVVCNNASTAAVTFTSPTTGGTIVYNWVNNTPSIGLAASGSGNIASFVATNPSTAPVTATINVTPVYTTTSAPTTLTFNYTGAMQTFTVPAGVTSITINASGAQGGSGAAGTISAGGNGGNGSKSSGTLAVTPGQVLNIFVGGAGTTPAGGFNGGGAGGTANAGGGGGASDVRYPGTTAANRLIVGAGGGGGGRAGCLSSAIGGDGGSGGGNGTNGQDAATIGGFAGGGAAASGANGGVKGIGCAGFSGLNGSTAIDENGAAGGLGQVCCCPSQPGGGGGGGGFIGGGGGGGGSAGTTACQGNDKGGGGGGAGGSNYTGGVTGGATANGTQTGNGVVTITFVPTLSCTGTPKSFTITVNPTATVTPVANQTVCNGTNTNVVNFTSPTTGGSIVYNWVNNTPSIGLAASGSGDIASFVATNVTAVPVTATITVTPSYTNAGVTCIGTPTSFTITVNPGTSVNTVPDQTVCNNALTAPVIFSGGLPGTVYSWTNTNTSIGLAANGNGNIPAFTAINTGTVPVFALITVVPTLNGVVTCIGAQKTFIIRVNPTPTVNAVANQVVCNGSPTTTVTFSGAVIGTTFNWTNNTTSIGLAASGTGTINSFTAINTTQVPVVATITVTPTYTSGGPGCPGTPTTFTITVNPSPVVTATDLFTQRICLSDTLIPLVGTPVGGSWTGIGVSGFNFIPTATAPGTYVLTYTFTNVQGCTKSDTTTIKVIACQERERLLSDDAVTLYPNPNNGHFNIKVNSTLYNYLGLKVYDMAGRLLTGNFVKNTATGHEIQNDPTYYGLVYGRVIPIDLSKLPAGTYLVELYYNDGIRTSKKGFMVVILK